MALLALAALTPNSSRASSATGGRGGADVIILPDQSVVLADPYAKKAGPAAQLNPVLVEEIKRAGKFLVLFGENSKFIDQHVFDSRVEYRFVDEIPKSDLCDRIESVALPTGAQAVLASCTDGLVTWIRDDLFKRMTVREQARLIIHERLHSLGLRVQHDFITDITEGLRLALYLDDTESEQNRLLLTADQIDSLTRLAQRLYQMGLSAGALPEEKLYVEPKGGGLLPIGSKVADTAYARIGTRVNNTSQFFASDINLSEYTKNQVTLGDHTFLSENGIANNGLLYLTDNARVLNSHLSNSVILEGSTVEDSDGDKMIIGKGSDLLRASVFNTCLGLNSKITDSWVQSMMIADDVRVTDHSMIRGNGAPLKIGAIASGARISKLISNAIEMIAENVVINDVTIGDESHVTIGANSNLSQVRFKWAKEINLGANSEISHSTLNSVTMGNHASIAGVNFHSVVYTFRSLELNLKDGAKVSNINLDMDVSVCDKSGECSPAGTSGEITMNENSSLNNIASTQIEFLQGHLSGNDGLKIEANAQLDFGGQPICAPNLILELRGIKNNIHEPAELQKYCKKTPKDN